MALADNPPVSVERFRALFEAQRLRALGWRESGWRERVARIGALRESILAHSADIHEAAAADFRKPLSEVDLTEIFPVLLEARHAMRHLRRWMRPIRVRPTLAMFGTRAEIRYEPKGTSLIMSPWNYPLNLSLGPLVSALAAGNPAIIKPSELTPHMARVIGQIVTETFSEDEVCVIEGGADTAQALLELPFEHIFFTGSPAIGSIVMAAAARHLSSCTLELGGKTPAIVDASADIPRAARNIVWGKFANNGQTCIAHDHVYVHAAVYERFIEEAARHVGEVYGDTPQAQRANPDYCRIVSPRHYERVSALLSDALDQGAKMIAGGGTAAEERFIAPTMLTDVDKNSAIMREEIFGPLLPILKFDDPDRVIDEINARPKPLALYLYCEDRALSERFVRRTSSGAVCINHSVVHFLHTGLPFGGVNASGMGKAHGIFGFRAFSNERSLLRERFSLTHLLMPPYSPRVRKLIALALRYLG